MDSEKSTLVSVKKIDAYIRILLAASLCVLLGLMFLPSTSATSWGICAANSVLCVCNFILCVVGTYKIVRIVDFVLGFVWLGLAVLQASILLGYIDGETVIIG